MVVIMLGALLEVVVVVVVEGKVEVEEVGVLEAAPQPLTQAEAQSQETLEQAALKLIVRGFNDLRMKNV